jgi:exosome complex component RRP41
VYGPREPSQRSDAEHDRAVITCSFAVAPFSTGEHRSRPRGDRCVLQQLPRRLLQHSHALCRRSQETEALILQALEGVVMTELFPRSAIAVYVQVLQSDGGSLIDMNGRVGSTTHSASLSLSL